jgi:ABC-type glycerol-3-phosphate transport system substrate-binding protein
MHRFIVIMLLLAFLAACRDALDPDAVVTAPAVIQPEQVTITLAVDGSSLNHYRPLIGAFAEENPTIQVRLVSLDEVADPDDSGIRALASSFDVFPYSPNRQGESQYLLDLRPFVDLDPHFDPDDFLPGLLPTVPEPLLAVPTGAAYYLTFFDKNAFAAAGLDTPKLDWTVDDFLAAAVALTTREGGEVTRWGYVPAQLRYSPLLATQLTGPLQTGDGLRLSDPDVVTAAQWLSDLFTVHQVSPWLDDYRPADRRSGDDGQSALGLINAGRAAMWHTTHVLYDENDEHAGVTAVPHGRHGLAAEPIIYGFAASRGTAQPEAAWQLLHFLSRRPPQAASMLSVGPLPARRSVAATNNYWEQLPDSLAPDLQYTAENSTPPRITLPAANLLQEAVAAHIDDGISVAVALAQSAESAPTPPEEADVDVIAVPNVEPEDQAARIQITFATALAVVEAHRHLANQFQEEQPDIAISVVEKDVRATGVLDQVAGSDCFVGNEYGGAGSWQDEDVRANLLPLTPLMELDRALQPEGFYPILIEQLMIDGQLWGIPAWIHAPYLEYNRDLFVVGNIPDPPLDWTLDDFLDIAQQLTFSEGETKQYGYAEFAVFFALGFTQAFGVQVVDDSAAIPHFDFEAAREMITWYVDLFRLHEVQPFIGEGTIADLDQFENLARRGRLAMWPGGFSDFIQIRGGSPMSFEVGVAALPIGTGGYRGEIAQIRPAAYHIAADSPHRQACWEWIKFLTTQPTAVPLQGASGRTMPAHIETAESEVYISLVGADMAAIIRDFMNFPPVPDAVPITPSPPWMGPGYDWLRDAYREAVSGEVSVTAALAEAEAKFGQYRQCIIERDGFDNPALWQACADEVNRTQ